MRAKTYTVPSISCDHCVHTIERELKGVAGVTFVSADTAAKTVTVEIGDQSSLPVFKSLMEEIGYALEN